MGVWKHLPSSLFVLLLSPIFLARSNRRKKRSRSVVVVFFFFFGGEAIQYIIRIMMINKDDRRGDSYLSASHTSLLRLDDDDDDDEDHNDEISIGTPKLWQVMMTEMAVVLVLRRSEYATICSFTAANIGGSNSSIWYQRQ